MPQFFATATTAQVAAFGARFAVGALVPHIATCISSFSTPKALMFSFFSNFSNLFALANDVRLQHTVRKQRKHKSGSSISLESFALALLAIAVAASVLLTDIVLFQFSEQKAGYRITPSTARFTIEDDTIDLGGREYQCPKAMLSESAARKAFGGSTYVSNDGGEYMNYTTVQDSEATISGPTGLVNLGEGVVEDDEYVRFEGAAGEVKVAGKNTGLPRCTVVSHLQIEGSASNHPTRLHCLLGDHFTSPSFGAEESLTVGFNGDKFVYFYQTREGANYMFLELVHRDYYRLGGFDTNSTAKLEASLDELSEEGYVIENALINGESIDMRNNHKSNMELVKAGAASSKSGFFQVQLLVSKQTVSYKFGLYPVYTSNYVLWTVQGNNHLLTGESHGSYSSLNYKTRQVLVRGKQIRSNLLGFTTDNFINAPVSAKISTSLTDDEVLLATLQNPASPLLVTEVELFNIFPSVVLTLLCCLALFSMLIFERFYRKNAKSRFPFHIDLEIYHRMLDTLTPSSDAVSLPCKMELTDNVFMMKGVSLLTNEYVVGLAERKTVQNLDKWPTGLDSKPSTAAAASDNIPLLERGINTNESEESESEAEA